MKRIISILVAMLMLLTMVPAFAASEANASSPSMAYLNTLSSVADQVGTITDTNKNIGNIGFNKDHPAHYEFSDGAVTITRTEGSAKTALTYAYFSPNTEKAIEDDVFAVGFDVKFSNITEGVKSNSVLNIGPGRTGTAFVDSTQEKIDSGEWVVGEGANANKAYDKNGTYKDSLTGWCFRKSGDTLSFQIKTDADGNPILGSNNQPIVYCGNAELLQDTFYTFKLYVNQNTKKYYVNIIDGDGNIMETGIDGTVQNAMTNLVKAEVQLQSGLNPEAAVTYDNYFFDKLTLNVSAPASFSPNESGTVSLGAAIPDTMVNPALYINDTFVENITVVPGKTDYNITATLPEGTMLGDVKFEIRGTLDGEAVSASSISKYYVGFDKPITHTYSSSKWTTGDDGVKYLGPGDTRTATLNPASNVNGLYEITAKIRRAPGHTGVVIRLRTNNFTPPGATSAVGYGALLDNSTGAWNTKDLSYFNTTDETAWYDFKLVMDYREDAFAARQPYSLTINGITLNGTFRMPQYSDRNGFVEFGMYGVHYRDVALKEIVEINPKSVSANYAGGTSATYDSEALISPGAENLAFEFTATPDSASGFSFVDESGAAVANTTLSVSGKSILVNIADGVVLPTGNYKLVADKTASFEGNALGAGLEVPVALNAPASVLAPADGKTVTEDNVTISFFADSAEKIEVYVNDSKVKTFAAPEADGIYTLSYAPTVAGTNYIDIYSYRENDIELASSSFVWVPHVTKSYSGSSIDVFTDGMIATDATSYGSTRAADVGKDGSVAVAISTCLVPPSSGNRFANLKVSGVHRIAVREYDIKINNDNTYLDIETGANYYGTATTGSGYFTVTGHPGRNAMFKNGKIASTTKTYEVGEWYRIKHIFDWEALKAYIYVDGELISDYTFTASAIVNNKATIGSYSKYRFNIMPVSTAEGSAIPSISIDNAASYDMSYLPTPSVASETIVAGTDSVDVTLNKAYDALTADKIAVTANGAAIEGAAAAISDDGLTITVSGLANVAAGTKVEIAIASDVLYSAVAAGKASVATIFVADSNNVCLLPLKVQSEDGTRLAAYSKYINGGDAQSTYLIMTEYDDDDAKRVKQTNFSPVSVKAGSVGIVSGYLTGVVKAQGCQVMLWNTDFAPLLEAGTISE